MTSIEDAIFSSSVSLDENVEYKNLTLNSGIIDLKGHTLTVYGDLYAKGGSIKINNGNLIVYGNCSIISTCAMYMQSINDYVLICGNFVYRSSACKNYNVFTAGELEVRGNFTTEKYDSTGLKATDLHKIIFSGNTAQVVSMSPNSRLNFIDIRNADISFLGYVHLGTLINDAVVQSFGADETERFSGVNIDLNG